MIPRLTRDTMILPMVSDSGEGIRRAMLHGLVGDPVKVGGAEYVSSLAYPDQRSWSAFVRRRNGKSEVAE